VLPVKEKDTKQKDEAVNGELIAFGDELIVNLGEFSGKEKDPNESQKDEKPAGDGDGFFKRVSFNHKL
jgi:hypothetical protein